MSRFLLSAAALFSLLVTALVLPVRTDARSRRCGEEPPETLLSLYRNSTEIHIGTFDRIEDVGMVEDTEDYSVIDMRKHFSISTTLKGEPRKFFVASEQDYRYKTVETEEPSEPEESEPAGENGDATDHEGEDPYLEGIAKPGDRVMIFLRKDDESGEVVLSHYRDAVKKLGAEEMAAYETRVNELNSIFAAKEVKDSEIVAWLVKTAVDPKTRWDGAFELLSGFQNSEWREERAQYLKEKVERGETLEEWERLDTESEEDQAIRSKIAYVKLITESQKQELLAAVVAGSGTETESDKPVKLNDGDRILIELVSRWGDDRLAAHLLSQLRNSPDLPYYNAQMMQMVAKALGSDALGALATKYGDLYGGDEEVASQEDLASVNDLIKPATEELPSETGEEAETSGPETIAAEAETPVPARTYAELRELILGKFISLGEEIMTTEAK